MKITDIRIKITDDEGDRLKAYCTITLDRSFVIRDLKIIGSDERLFIAMPSRKLTDSCPKCRSKNHLRARYCNDCGQRLDPDRALKKGGDRPKLHIDVAHPIAHGCRERLHEQIIEAYYRELEKSQNPDYVPTDLGADYHSLPKSSPRSHV